METQTCKRCGKEKSLSKFYTKKFTKTGTRVRSRKYDTGKKYYWKICKKCIIKNNNKEKLKKKRKITGNVIITNCYCRVTYRNNK